MPDEANVSTSSAFFNMDIGLESITIHRKKPLVRLPENPIVYPAEKVVESQLPRLLDVDTVETGLLTALKPHFQQPNSWNPQEFRHYMVQAKQAIEKQIRDLKQGNDQDRAYCSQLKALAELLANEEEDNELLRTLRMILIQEK